jgi:hypothetical protein
VKVTPKWWILKVVSQMGIWKKSLLADLRLPKWAVGKAALITFGFVVCALYFAPVVRTFWWHLHNGTSIVLKGQTIPVPLEWVADAGAQGIRLTKWHRTVLYDQPFQSWISFNLSPYPYNEGRDEVIKSWEALYWAGQSETDNVVSGPLKIGSKAGDVLCMESYSKKHPKLAAADCLIFDANLDASFSGEEKDVDTFLQIIQGIYH